MKPRELLLSVILVLGLVAPSLTSCRQQQPAAKVYRIGWLGNTPPAATDTTPQRCPIEGNPYFQQAVQGLQEHGYVLGQNLVIECRYTAGPLEERAAALAAELVSLKPDLIIGTNTRNVRALKQGTSAIPIVMGGVIDPVARGLVASLAQPGGNVTGVTSIPIEFEGKRLQLLKEALPTVSRVAGYAPFSRPDRFPPAGRRTFRLPGRADAGRGRV